MCSGIGLHGAPEMSKRGLGIPHLDHASLSKRSKWATLGVHVPAGQPGKHTDVGTVANRRKDAPRLRLGVQASDSKDGKPSDHISNIEDARRHYENDKYAASSLGSRNAVVRTWHAYHEKAHRLDPITVGAAAFPMTVASLKSIAALMKLDGYRSFSNYASWAKGHHIEEGHDWTQQLAHELTQAGRSLGRGLGPPRQSATFDLERLALTPEVVSRKPGSPLFPKQALLLGSLWVLREIELAWTKWGDIVIDSDSSVIHWTLTASKTDPAAKSCTRKWGCLCAELGIRVCPYHVMQEYRNNFLEYFGLAAGSLDDILPVFPDFEGNVILKTGVVDALEKTLITIGEAPRDAAGRRRFGGHSCRVAGSRFWASHGMEVHKLQIFARWGSDVILRYVADSPLHQVKLTTPSSSVASSSAGSREDPEHNLLELNVKLAKLTAFVEDAVAEVQALKDDIARRAEESRRDFVQNTTTKCWHEVLLGDVDVPPALWKTRCGWRFARLEHERCSRVPSAGNKCDRCFGRPSPSSSGSSSS